MSNSLPKLSIVIPALNEEQFIDKTLSSVRAGAAHFSSCEVILVDTGSLDNTIEIARGHDAQVHVRPEFKGKKYDALNYGAKLSKAEALLFLDADCVLPDNYDEAILTVLARRGFVGGAFEFRSDNRSWSMRIIELLNRIRYRISQTYYGDQGIFCSKKVFLEVHGYPEEPIMEAAFFCRELLKMGKLSLVRRSMVTSARRFVQGGIWQVMLKDTWIWVQYLLGISIRRYARQYWEENDRRGLKRKGPGAQCNEASKA